MNEYVGSDPVGEVDPFGLQATEGLTEFVQMMGGVSGYFRDGYWVDTSNTEEHWEKTGRWGRYTEEVPTWRKFLGSYSGVESGRLVWVCKCEYQCVYDNAQKQMRAIFRETFTPVAISLENVKKFGKQTGRKLIDMMIDDNSKEVGSISSGQLTFSKQLSHETFVEEVFGTLTGNFAKQQAETLLGKRLKECLEVRAKAFNAKCAKECQKNQ